MSGSWMPLRASRSLFWCSRSRKVAHRERRLCNCPQASHQAHRICCHARHVHCTLLSFPSHPSFTTSTPHAHTLPSMLNACHAHTTRPVTQSRALVCICLRLLHLSLVPLILANHPISILVQTLPREDLHLTIPPMLNSAPRVPTCHPTQ